MKKKEKLPRMTNVEVRIVKMCESSGNEQFFVRLVRTDAENAYFTDGILEHACWQTKNLEKAECLSRAWFDAGFLARFVSLNSVDDIVLINIDEDEKAILKSSMTLFRGN